MKNEFQNKLDKLLAKKSRLLKLKGYEKKGYCYMGDFYEYIGDNYSDLQDYVVDNFGWSEWFDTNERNSILAECGVVVQFDNENGTIIYYSQWVQKKKELSYKEFNKWIATKIKIDNLPRCDYDDWR